MEGVITAQKRVDKTAREAMSTVTAVQKDVKAARKAETEVRREVCVSVLDYTLYTSLHTFLYTRVHHIHLSFLNTPLNTLHTPPYTRPNNTPENNLLTY